MVRPPRCPFSLCSHRNLASTRGLMFAKPGARRGRQRRTVEMSARNDHIFERWPRRRHGGGGGHCADVGRSGAGEGRPAVLRQGYSKAANYRNGATDFSARRGLRGDGGAAATAAFAGVVGTIGAVAAAQRERSDHYYGGGPAYYGGRPAYYDGGPAYYGGGPAYYEGPAYGYYGGFWPRSRKKRARATVAAIAADLDLVDMSPHSEGAGRAASRGRRVKVGSKFSRQIQAIVNTLAMRFDLGCDSMSDLLDRLYQAVLAAKDLDPATSRTARLFQRGPAKMAKKLAEEAIEVVIDAVNGKSGCGDPRKRGPALQSLGIVGRGRRSAPGCVGRDGPARTDARGSPKSCPNR